MRVAAALAVRSGILSTTFGSVFVYRCSSVMLLMCSRSHVRNRK